MQINVDLIYPIGSIYMSVNTVSPQTLFGGTWEQITDDAYLKIVSSNPGELGGTSKDHKIPIESMPSHSHTIVSVWGGGTAVSGEHIYYVSGGTGSSRLASDKNGGGQPYYPYYLGVYVWKRTA